MKKHPPEKKRPGPSPARPEPAGRLRQLLPHLPAAAFAVLIAGAAFFYQPILTKLSARALCYADPAGVCASLASPLPGGLLAWCAHGLASTGYYPLLGVALWLLLAAGVTLIGLRRARCSLFTALLPAALGIWQVAYCGFSLWIFAEAAFPYLNLMGWGLYFLITGTADRRGLWALAALALYPLCGTPVLLGFLGCAAGAERRLRDRLLFLAAALLPPVLWKFGTYADPAWRPILLANAPFLCEAGALLWDAVFLLVFLGILAAPAAELRLRRAPLPPRGRIAAAAAVPVIFCGALWLGMDPIHPLYDVLACERALARGDLQTILNIPPSRAAAHRMLGAYRIYALWRTDRLADELFDVPWTVSHDASTIDTMELDGYTLLYEYGIVQLARRWAYESVINKGWTADKYLLLARIALILDEPEMARRYALQLRRLPFRGAAADEIFAFLDTGRPTAALARIGDIHFRLARDTDAPVFEGDKRLEPGIYNRYSVLKNGSKEMVTLYLCASLLRKDTLPFIENYEVIRRVWTERPLPRVFQQALLAAASTQPPERQIRLTADLFSPGLPPAFSLFQQAAREGTPSPDFVSRFHRTYWFYSSCVP